MNKQTDIIVVGCGIVGCTTALLLADNDFTVRVIDAKKFAANAELQASAWVSSLNLSSEKILQQIGIDLSELELSTPITALDVKDVGAGRLKFSCNNIAKSHLATIVDNAALLHCLRAKLQQHKNIILNTGEAVLELKNADVVTVKTPAAEYSADLLLAADGAKSKLREMAEIKFSKRSYQHSALVATIKTELPHNNIGRQWFHASGPLAFLPIDNNNTQAIVWSTADAAAWLDQDSSALAQALTEHSESTLGQVSQPDNMLAFPLFARHAEDYFANKVCLLGDAAHTIHPLAGMGANLGLADAACLAKVLCAAKRKACAIADPIILRKYQRQRRAENLVMLQMMRFLQQNTAATGSVALAVRKLAIGIIDKSACLQRMFMRAAT